MPRHLTYLRMGAEEDPKSFAKRLVLALYGPDMSQTKCDTPKCPRPAMVTISFAPGEEFHWCEECDAEIKQQVNAVMSMISEVKLLEKKPDA